MTLHRLLSAVFPGTMQAQYDAGYRAAVDKILLLPEKVRLGNTLTVDADVRDCSFVGGAPAILVVGERRRIENVRIDRADIGIQMSRGPQAVDTIRLSSAPRSEP